MSSRRWRHGAVWLHRWVGLVIAGFLVVTAATGAVIAFYDEIESWLVPELMVVAIPRDGSGAAAPMIDPLVLRAAVERRHAGAVVDWVDLHREPGRTQAFGLSYPAGEGSAIDDEVFVDPYTGMEVGARRRGDLMQGRRNAMPFLMALHESLALGEAGRWALGVAALLWTLDCFVGLALTFPLRRQRSAVTLLPSPSWRSRWMPAWRIRRRSSFGKLVFDTHRALSLWIWGVLLAFAWSSVGFNLADVYRPIMGVFGFVVTAPPVAGSGRSDAPVMGWEDALLKARHAVSEESRVRGFDVIRERLMAHHPEAGTFELRTLSTLDVGRKLGNTTVFVDDRTGQLTSIDLPTGQRAANTVDTWLANLHTAAVGGLWMQMTIAAIGLAIVTVTITGVELYRRRLAARLRQKDRAASRVRPTAAT